MPLLETSAKDDINIDSVFKQMVQEIRKASSARAESRRDMLAVDSAPPSNINLGGPNIGAAGRKKLLPCCS